MTRIHLYRYLGEVTGLSRASCARRHLQECSYQVKLMKANASQYLGLGLKQSMGWPFASVLLSFLLQCDWLHLLQLLSSLLGKGVQHGHDLRSVREHFAHSSPASHGDLRARLKPGYSCYYKDPATDVDLLGTSCLHHPLEALSIFYWKLSARIYPYLGRPQRSLFYFLQ